MGSGLAEVFLLAALTIIVLPCCFFTLLALLDRFERSLDPTLQTPLALVAKMTPVPAVATDGESAGNELVGADVVALPVALTVAGVTVPGVTVPGVTVAGVTVAEAPAAATG